MKVGVVIGTVAGIGAGMIIADIVTKGAVREAAADIFSGIRHKGGEAVEAVADTAERVSENIGDVASDAAEVIESI